MKKVLFLGCHCDDIELGCGATIFKHQNDWAIRCVTLSENGLNNANYSLMTESRKALESLGVKELAYFNNPVNDFPSCRQKIWQILHNLDELITPDLVFTQEADNQQDHETLYKETLRNFRSASIVTYKSSIRNAPNHQYNYFETVSQEACDAKIKSLQYYPGYKNFLYFNPKNVEAIMRVNGIYAQTEFAEAFNAVKLIY